jgi:type IV pilus assembly protein PilA
MKTLQKGFTLIELMIVVAIIGILAAIAVPAYQDYTIKSKVSEAASLASAVKTAVEVAFSEGFEVDDTGGGAGTIPGPSTLGVEVAANYNGKYVSSVAYSQDGIVTVTLRSDTALGLPANVRGNTVIYTPTDTGGNLKWGVSGGASFPAKYLPKT